MSKDLETLIMSAVDLPTIPLVATKVIEMIEQEDVTIEKLAQTVSTDPAVAARILKLSNSAYYGCQRQINTLSAAIMLLGFKTLKSLVVAVSLKQISKRFGLTEKMLWEHSVGAALAARLIASRTKFINEETGFLAGLFHDIGKTIMNDKDPQKFQSVIVRCYNDGLPFEEVERSVYPFSHAEVGALVIKKWNFPDSLSTAIMYHHQFSTAQLPDQYELFLTATTSLADKFCKRLGIGSRQPEAELDLANQPEAKLLGYTPESVAGDLETFIEIFEENKGVFLNE
ncbi:HD family phosphohydrolase [Geotalea uraniireducens]|uniref:HD family phosphohydrolase n=1 Tax=Geotalea uraniireducens TaxID=351604 RepID=A0ABM8EPN1_9BACT|nr:HDOD domain-containing protein [Geotalea uraniireducens]BDV44414.1 HD family phosphohydrolase [Geotalea uraniireducens]